MNKESQSKMVSKEIVNSKQKLITWLKSHKKQLLLAGISIPSVLVVALGLKNKDAILELLDQLQLTVEKKNIYNPYWLKKATTDKLQTEREKVRLDYCSAGDDVNTSIYLENLLRKFDTELSNRAWKGETPHGPNFHREHGWYLSNDD